MKIRVMYGESFVTHCGYEDYVVDLDKFPNLKGKSEKKITEWLYNNKNNLSVVEYDDPAPRDKMGNANEIVPQNEGDETLADSLGYQGVMWDKITDEERYFSYIREETDEESEVSG